MMDYLDVTKRNPVGTAACGLLLGFVVYYRRFIVRHPVIAANPRLTTFLHRHCPVLNRCFWPTVWCFEGRLQTLIRALLQTSPSISYRKEFICTSDGGHVALDWMDNNTDNKYTELNRPTIILLPGLTDEKKSLKLVCDAGSSQESYALHLVHQASKLGYRTVVFNYRGFGGADLKTPRTYCATNVEDLTEVVAHVRLSCPDAPLIAAGISLGGLILTNYVMKMEDRCPLVAAMSVSVAWDVFESTKSLEEPLNSLIFNKHLTDNLVSAFQQNAELFKEFDASQVLKCRTIREFDEVFTSRQFGYPSHKEYYEDAVISSRLHSVKIPLLALNAADDMFSPQHAIPLEEATKSDNVAIAMTHYGGHIGFLEGLLPRGESYMDQVFCQFVDAIFKYRQELC